MLGYGIAGLLRKTLVYPSNMLYPSNLPTASLLENLHADRKNTEKKMKVFYIAFVVVFIWQVLPQYISKSPFSSVSWPCTDDHSAASCWCFGVLFDPSQKPPRYESLWWIHVCFIPLSWASLILIYQGLTRAWVSSRCPLTGLWFVSTDFGLLRLCWADESRSGWRQSIMDAIPNSHECDGRLHSFHCSLYGTVLQQRVERPQLSVHFATIVLLVSSLKSTRAPWNGADSEQQVKFYQVPYLQPDCHSEQAVPGRPDTARKTRSTMAFIIRGIGNDCDKYRHYGCHKPYGSLALGGHQVGFRDIHLQAA